MIDVIQISMTLLYQATNLFINIFLKIQKGTAEIQQEPTEILSELRTQKLCFPGFHGLHVYLTESNH